MKKLIDMGMHHGERVFYTGGSSLAELMEAGEIVALLDEEKGVIYKRTVNCSSVEIAAKLSVKEATERTKAWNRKLE